jgi:hypothetical protein
VFSSVYFQEHFVPVLSLAGGFGVYRVFITVSNSLPSVLADCLQVKSGVFLELPDKKAQVFLVSITLPR